MRAGCGRTRPGLERRRARAFSDGGFWDVLHFREVGMGVIQMPQLCVQGSVLTGSRVMMSLGGATRSRRSSVERWWVHWTSKCSTDQNRCPTLGLAPRMSWPIAGCMICSIWAPQSQGSGHGVIFRVGLGVVFDFVAQGEVGAGVSGVGGSQVLTEFGDGGGGPLCW